MHNFLNTILGPCDSDKLVADLNMFLLKTLETL